MFKTIREAAAMLDVNTNRLRKAVQAGTVPAMRMGNRMLVDVDAARGAMVEPVGVKIEDVSAATGLTVTALRRAIREGWLPCTKPGKAYLFNMDEVNAAIAQRVREQTKK